MTVLLRGVGTGETQHHLVSGHEGAKRTVVELFPIICLNASDRTIELGLNERVKGNKRRKNIRLLRKGKLQTK
jgi:hypothetical protein